MGGRGGAESSGGVLQLSHSRHTSIENALRVSLECQKPLKIENRQTFYVAVAELLSSASVPMLVTPAGHKRIKKKPLMVRPLAVYANGRRFCGRCALHGPVSSQITLSNRSFRFEKG